VSSANVKKDNSSNAERILNAFDITASWSMEFNDAHIPWR
jgi:hypothetical protein